LNPIKLALARGFDTTGLNRLMLSAQKKLLSPFIRALNYHDVPGSHAQAFDEQLSFYREHFVPVGRAEVDRLLRGEWPHERPGLLLSFDDGLRSHAEVVAPLLERHGFPGWFAVPAGYPDGEQPADEPPAMTWDQVRTLDEGHVICCHTYSHRRLAASLDEDERRHEIEDAKAHLEQMLGHEVDVFVWVGGEEWSYSADAAREVERAGFRLALMTNNETIRPGAEPFHLQRTNVEADYPPSLMRFSLSGFFDLMYVPKRRRVNRLTASSA